MRKSAIILAVAAFALAATPCLAQTAQLEANKKAVVEFYNKAINEKNFEAARKYMGPKYIQHNPGAADGHAGLQAFLTFLKEKFPNAKSEIKRVFAEGDYVILHVHAVREPRTRGNAIVDIFRLEHGKIVEHWDVIQPIPEKPMNANGMF